MAEEHWQKVRHIRTSGIDDASLDLGRVAVPVDVSDRQECLHQEPVDVDQLEGP